MMVTPHNIKFYSTIKKLKLLHKKVQYTIQLVHTTLLRSIPFFLRQIYMYLFILFNFLLYSYICIVEHRFPFNPSKQKLSRF